VTAPYETLLAARNAAQEQAEETDTTVTIYVCQGKPRCASDLNGDAGLAYQRSCLFCERIYVAPDGSERVDRPHEA
jgi:hypothetical protein